MRRLKHRGRADVPPNEVYAGIPIYAAAGVHGACMELVGAHVPSGSRVMELGAGSGAFTRRLLDGGYRVTAGELDASAWRVPEVTPLQMDLNEPLGPREDEPRFDAVVAIEVIEHLENPLKLLRDCRALCRPGGHVILTTPNVVDHLSYARYLTKGRFHYFDERTYWETGHISLLPWWLLEAHCEQVGLTIVERRTVGRRASGGRAWLSRVTQNVFQRLCGSGIPRELRIGPCLCYVLLSHGRFPGETQGRPRREGEPSGR